MQRLETCSFLLAVVVTRLCEQDWFGSSLLVDEGRVIRGNAEKQDKSKWKSRRFTLPSKAAPCLIHVRLSSGITADAFPDVSHLCQEKDKSQQWRRIRILYISKSSNNTLIMQIGSFQKAILLHNNNFIQYILHFSILYIKIGQCLI